MTTPLVILPVLPSEAVVQLMNLNMAGRQFILTSSLLGSFAVLAAPFSGDVATAAPKETAFVA